MSKIKKQQVINAKVGDIVTFNRKYIAHEGVVYQVREKSVLVNISKDSQTYLGYENRNTVVSHMNYTILLNHNVVNE
ncbi:DUF2187 family protein [Bacillus sp. BRMEA1]|uniref:DUF2187 family protein n=1 Tax=Neobacillus endophyticus TaxID=2738405 RepID=UPI0015673483|nr:DUF2187 family protein [Neobacillus endophyticus]NRD76916.1 DUF2187 family protein [Neobacillus endophyticus]